MAVRAAMTRIARIRLTMAYVIIFAPVSFGSGSGSFFS